MGLLTRHILTDFAKIFGLTLLAATGCMLAVALAQLVMERGFTIPFATLLIPYIWVLPVRFAIPCACVFSACSVFGRLSAANELMAVRAAGASPLVLVWPVLLITVPLSLLCVRLEDLGLTWGHDRAERTMVKLAGDVLYDALRTRRVYRTKDFEIVVQHVDGQRLINPVITVFSGQERETRIVADVGVLSSAYPKPELQVSLSQGTILTPYGYELHFSDHWEQPLPLTTKRGEAFDIRRIREQQQEIVDLRAAISSARSTAVARSADTSHLQRLQKTLEQSERWLERLEARFHKKWCTAFCCLFGTMLAIPIAILLRTGDLAQSFFLCFLPIVLLYYPATSFWYELAKGGSLPESSVWTCNVAMGLISARLLWRVHRR